MSELATEPRGSARGSALVSTLVAFVALFGLAYVSTIASAVEVRDSRRAFDEVRAAQLAECGFERGMHFLGEVVKKTGVHDPLQGLSDLFAGSGTVFPFLGEPVMDGGVPVGEFTVSLSLVEESSQSITIAIDTTGYLPAAPAHLGPRERVSNWHALTVTVQYGLAPGQVFDYAYFINNWGWFYGSSIVCNGNARSNGQFDAAGYSPWINAQPTYDGVSWNGSAATLFGYHDDNGDELLDGNDGGVFSGWDIVAAQNVRGVGGEASNQHDFQDKVDMPNLSDLSSYEAQAVEGGGSITIGGSPMCDAVQGDEAGELDNLYLIGTESDPIVIDGKIVVRGDVIIAGCVTGQGAIYAGGNVYCPDSIRYADPPTSPRPAGNQQAQTEAWLSQNWDRDFLGLFARENVVVGDHTDSLWRSYVSGWMGSSLNKSEEDAGEDGIPNTRAGRDGIVGTADDDLLEDDGVFSVERYTEEDLELGLIPPGFGVGDPIPGTGEDIDGDGQFDDTTTLADVDFSTPLDASHWGGNMPPGGIASYGEIATLYASWLDAVFYTNHSFCYLVLGGESARINGALVSRNENIIYGTPTIEMNYDCRLLGGNSGMAGGLLPKVMRTPRILRWMRLDRDPNHYAGAE